MRLEDITKGMMVNGLVPERIATIVSVDHVSTDVFNVVYKCEGSLLAETQPKEVRGMLGI